MNMWGQKNINFLILFRGFLNSSNLMIFHDLIVKILRIILLCWKNLAKFILKIKLLFVLLVSLKILLKISLWVRINGMWNYILVLFDVKFNILVSLKLVELEDFGIIYYFLNESLRNQDIFSIVTDLKYEYCQAIDKLKVNYLFCKFHVK